MLVFHLQAYNYEECVRQARRQILLMPIMLTTVLYGKICQGLSQLAMYVGTAVCMYLDRIHLHSHHESCIADT